MNSVKLKDLLKSYLSGKITFKELKDRSANSDIQDLCEAYYDEEVSRKFFEGELLKKYNSLQINTFDCPVCGDKASVKIEHVESGFWHPPGSEEAKKLNTKGFDGNRRHPLTSEICQECYMKIFNTGMYYSII